MLHEGISQEIKDVSNDMMLKLLNSIVKKDVTKMAAEGAGIMI